jgi:AraC-like DNA-binding protein
METLASADTKVSRRLLSAWSKMYKREFYEGDLEFDGQDRFDFSFDKAIAYPASLTRLSARCSLAYRRTWSHIRSNKIGFRVIWFVSKGTLRISRSHGSCEVTQNQAAILDSGAPFYAKVIPDAEGQYESLQLTVPADMFLAHLQEADKLTAPFSLDTPEGRVVQHLLEVLVKDGDYISSRSAKPLVESVLEAVADCLGDAGVSLPARQRLVDKRLADIKNYILMNLSDPDLCYDRVAASCGISPRYLCYVLKSHNTSFSELLWKNRLPRARDLLLSPATRHYPIHEIAFMCGFKSAAHFSRMFNAAYGCPPRQFRMTAGAAARTQDGHAELSLPEGVVPLPPESASEMARAAA